MSAEADNTGPRARPTKTFVKNESPSVSGEPKGSQKEAKTRKEEAKRSPKGAKRRPRGAHEDVFWSLGPRGRQDQSQGEIHENMRKTQVPERPREFEDRVRGRLMGLFREPTNITMFE